MASSSPSELLTFFRRARPAQTLHNLSITRLPTPRPFTASLRHASSAGGEKKDNKDNQHVLNKQDEPNIQSYESKKGQENRAQNTGGQATEQRDTRNSTAKAKQEHPEAPETVIGMQDERGGKGH